MGVPPWIEVGGRLNTVRFSETRLRTQIGVGVTLGVAKSAAAPPRFETGAFGRLGERPAAGGSMDPWCTSGGVPMREIRTPLGRTVCQISGWP